MILMPMHAGVPMYESDTFSVDGGTLTITFLGHGTLMIDFKGTVIHIDPFGDVAAYDTIPKADLILVTHEHGDHLDPSAVSKIRKSDTVIIVNQAGASRLPGSIVMTNGQTRTEKCIKIEAVPAYNIVNLRAPNQPYHPRGIGNGYILDLGGKRVYIAGDTENIPEMKILKNIDIAFLPMNLPYTMSPEMAADAAKSFRPKILYPYHYGHTDTDQIVALLKNEPGIEVRIRKLK